MNIKDIISATYTALSKLSKSSLLKAIKTLREKYIELEKKSNELNTENEKLKKQLKGQKIKSVNKDANKPSSKRPEWEKKRSG